MSKIKSLADQLKSKLEEQKEESKILLVKTSSSAPFDKKVGSKEIVVDAKQLDSFLSSLREYNMDGQEKILIRIDKRTLNLLKQLKTACNIDMTRVIVFSLHQYLKAHPWLNQYISQTLKNMTHELD
ncbi:hypothetical protein GJU39_01355 [Pedobacter petrophilus]|uniref:Uncharacterized protein n=1 Tax=Pedobacter petrophilus TaxID=1908241 RepID=A0A7K0FTK5_9SPHI|nr:hypothetical protein [Pedobacter petrophilus]MRX74721.1 hypothetical protein [Pedobacter petrophilus]